ncbi:MAG: carbohydrate ABC transporter permease [Eubacteriales bacterium]|nr:carbohydrate ABC transporter permease [Christensenellaceae bacterium]MEA5065627.1 carbohydrate ABC transporter permease [Eubacteriales bacterium]
MKNLPKRALTYLLMFALALLFLFPILWAVMSSFKTEQNVVAYPPQLLPSPFVMANYQTVLSRYPYLNWMGNSLLVTGLSTLLVLVISSLAAYPLARMEFKLRGPLFALITAMMLIPIQGYMIPLFKFLSMAGLRRTPGLSQLSLVLTAGANITSLFILTSFFKELPISIEEAAQIDGCSELRFFAVILLPLSKAALSSVAILTFITNWNQFLWPSIMLSGDKNLTLPVGMARYFGAAANDAAFRYGPSLAAACMAVLPTIAVFLLLQRYFVEGIASTGIKG